MLSYFRADWCGPCRVFEQGTLSRKIVVNAARPFVALRADMTQGESPASQEVGAKYGVMAYPTIVFIETKLVYF